MPPSTVIKTPPSSEPPLEFYLKSTRQPMLWAALSYSTGIVVGAYAWRPASWWIAAGAVFLAAGLYLVRRRRLVGLALALGTCFFAGALHVQLRGSTFIVDTSLQSFPVGQPVLMTAH